MKAPHPVFLAAMRLDGLGQALTAGQPVAVSGPALSEIAAVMYAAATEIRELRAQVRDATQAQAGTCETCAHWIRIERDQQCSYTYGRCTRMKDEDYPYPHEPIVVYADAAPYWVWTMPTASCSMHALAQAQAGAGSEGQGEGA